MPLTGVLALCIARRNRRIRFHAWQSVLLGGSYIGVLMGLSVLDAVGGALFRWAGAFVAAAAPVVGAFVTMVWVVVIVQIMRGHEGRIPLIGGWAERRSV